MRHRAVHQRTTSYRGLQRAELAHATCYCWQLPNPATAPLQRICGGGYWERSAASEISGVAAGTWHRSVAKSLHYSTLACLIYYEPYGVLVYHDITDIGIYSGCYLSKMSAT
jgi:hypothetical protein